MKIELRRTLAAASLAATLGSAAFAFPAAAQSDAHQHPQGMGGRDMGGMMGGQGMGGMMGGQGMGGMMGCPMMSGGAMGGGHAMPHLPPGNEKLELQMHAEMMKAMGDIMAKYAARLPDKK